jgi:hypothetical protein
LPGRIDSKSNANGNSYSNSYCYSYCYSHSHGNRFSDCDAHRYSDATTGNSNYANTAASANTSASSVGL